MASSLSVGLPHQEVSSQLPLDSCLTPAVQTIRDVPTEGGLARTDPPSPRALPPWHRRASGEEVSQTAGPGQARRLQPLPREEGRPEAVGSHNLSPRPCPHHHCTCKGQPPLGPGRDGPWTPRAPIFHHFTLQQPPRCHGNRQAPSGGGTDLPVHGLRPRGLQLSLGAQKGGGQGEAGPSALRGDFCGFQEKGGYALRSGGTEGAGFDLPATWALYCLCFLKPLKCKAYFALFSTSFFS